MRYIFETATGELVTVESKNKVYDKASVFEPQEAGFNSSGEFYKCYREVNREVQAEESAQSGIKAGDVVRLNSGGPDMTVFGRSQSTDGWIVLDLAYWCETREEFRVWNGAEDLFTLVKSNET